MKSKNLHEYSVISITELTYAIKRQIESSFDQLVIQGEVSNFKAHHSGHWYFTLKDENAQIPIVMWKSKNLRLNFLPKEGSELIAAGFLKVFEKGGRYQFDADFLQVASQKGDLFKKFEQLKAKLKDEGLFDPDQKKEINPYPKKILLITSPTGAVLQDMLTIFARRFPAIKLFLLPVPVQGEAAAEEIADAILKANNIGGFDTLILARGGGSIEDLWPFNEEVVARAIFASEIPVLTGIGHETDFTIADFTADYRASTPSVAAETASPSRTELSERLNFHKSQLTAQLIQRIQQVRENLKNFDERLSRFSPLNQLVQKRQTLDVFYDRLVQQIKMIIAIRIDRLKANENLLQSLSPNAILSRGYAIVRKKDKVVSSVLELSQNENIKILFKDGQIGAKVKEVNNE